MFCICQGSMKYDFATAAAKKNVSIVRCSPNGIPTKRTIGKESGPLYSQWLHQSN